MTFERKKILVKRCLSPIFFSLLAPVFGALLLVTLFFAAQPSHLASATSGPVLHLPLDETAGATTFADVSGYNHPATCVGASCPTAGVTGHLNLAAQFTGTQYLTVTDAPTPTMFTLSAWFQWDDVGTANVQFLTGKGLTNMELHTGGIGVNGLRFIPAGYPNTYVDAPGVIVSGWNHVAATYDGSTAQVYVNGVLVAQRTGITGGNNLAADATPLNLGRRSDDSYYFKGRLDDMRVYDRVLSAVEIFLLAEKPLILSKAVTPTTNVSYHGVVTYTITLANVGILTETNVLVTDTLPTQVAFAGWANTPPANTLQAGQNITWTGDILAGQTLTWTWTVTHTGQRGELVDNTAYVQNAAQAGQASAAFSVECGPAITVQNTHDSGAGSLRQAILGTCPGGAIGFAPALAGQTITLTAQLEIAKALTLDGGSLSAPVTLSGNHAVRILSVSNSAHVTLNHLQFVAGAAPEAYSGGLYLNSGTVVTLTHSAVLSCTAVSGGGLYSTGSTLTVQNSTFSGNSATVSGGGFYSDGSSTLTVQDSTFSGNLATYGGGLTDDRHILITVQNSTFSGNSATYGAGLTNYHGTLTVQNSTFSGNSADYGGGIWNLGDN